MAGTYDLVAALADRLARRGLAHVCISPGSRSTPLALTFARHPDIRHWVHLDERSAAFFALGIGRATGTPAAVITTSGTASAELYPAVIEARFGRVPLILLTADRPPRLRGTGANQTIDQLNLYGTNAKLFRDLPLAPDAGPAEIEQHVDDAWRATLTAPAGPAHLNVPLDEPLVPAGAIATRSSGTTPPAWSFEPIAPSESDLAALGDLSAEPQGTIIAGPLTDGSLQKTLPSLARAVGWPIIADPASGLRAGDHDTSHVIGHGDALAQAGWFDRSPPRAVIRFGPVPVSKAINTWLASHPKIPYGIVDTTGWPDPGNTAQTVVTADPATTATRLAAILEQPVDSGWLATWKAADIAAGEALAQLTDERFSEPGAVDTVLRSSPDPSTVWAASSMPIRHVDLMLGVTDHGLRLLANRGASGIDGFLSSALGSCAATGEATVAIAGDLSMLYDLTALGWAARNPLPITIVVINNDGGGIFSFLPQAPLPEFEELFATPHGLDFAGAAEWFGLDYTRAETTGELVAAMAEVGPGPRLVEVRFDRAAGVVAYRDAVEAVRHATTIGGSVSDA